MLARLTLALLLFTGIASAQHAEDVFVGQQAPELKGGDIWINTPPLTLESLRGKVVVISFWAYDCEFCAEALPHVKALHEKYAGDGLVVIGIHTPRFDREKELASVREAVSEKGIGYPVVTDNQYQMWSDYLCNVWPSHFVVDQAGVIQLSHSGTGRYEDTEKVVQRLLGKE